MVFIDIEGVILDYPCLFALFLEVFDLITQVKRSSKTVFPAKNIMDCS